MASVRVCLQWTLILYNILSLIIGVLAILASIYEINKFNEGSDEHVEKIVQLVAASVLVLSALIGCFAAINGSISIIGLYIFVLVALIATHSWKLWRYNELKQQTATEMLVTYSWIEELVKPGAMSPMQERYECCGKKSYTDYTSLGLRVPQSCYRVKTLLKSYFPFPEGCMSAVKKAYLEVYRYEKWAHWSLIGFEFCGILLSFGIIYKIASKTKSKSRTYRY